ncbi:MAG: hypothetical protein R3D89_04340 [Sphingomonadaceae bacterium]
MIIHPELRALRGDDSPQRDDQDALVEAVDAWRSRQDVAQIFDELDGFAAGGPIENFPALAALFDGSGHAARFIDEMIALVGAAFAEAMLAHLPFRYYCDDVVSTLQLGRAGRCSLALTVLDGEALAARPAPTTADFSSCEIWESVLAGAGQAQGVTCADLSQESADLAIETIALKPGTVFARQAWREALIVEDVEGRLVSLRLQRRLRETAPTREFRLSDGQFVHQAAGNPTESRTELMMALAGRMKLTESAPVLADIALDGCSAALRWQALRECLALDTQEGFAVLCQIAASPGDDLAHPAGALRSQLIETYPQLGDLPQCRA